jgi:hypothetical protein
MFSSYGVTVSNVILRRNILEKKSNYTSTTPLQLPYTKKHWRKMVTFS